MKRLAIAALAACLGVTTAAASVPTIPSPAAHKTPVKGPLRAPARHTSSPTKPKAPGLSSATRAQVAELMERGSRAFDRRDWAGAIDAYTQAIALDPTNASAHYNLASANYWGVVDWAKAEAEYRIALSYDPHNRYYQDGLDTVVRRRAEEEVAKVQNRQYAEQVEAINREGVANYSAGRFEAAEQLFSRALQMTPANAQIRANLEAARQQIAAAEQRRRQAALQQQQYEQQQRQYAYERAQRAKRAELFNSVTQGLALGAQIAEANRPPPRPAPTPQPTYSSAPRQYATTSPQARAPTQSAPAPAPSLGPLPANCITMRPPTAGTFWQVVNSCPAAVIGNFCYLNDNIFNCGTQLAGGFGPIRPGGYEAVSAPSKAATGWRISACYYDDDLKGVCHPGQPR